MNTIIFIFQKYSTHLLVFKGVLKELILLFVRSTLEAACNYSGVGHVDRENGALSTYQDI